MTSVESPAITVGVSPADDFARAPVAGLAAQAIPDMDWRSLRLVFDERRGDGWWLIAIVSDQWTI
jgi:hypothetical protein